MPSGAGCGMVSLGLLIISAGGFLWTVKTNLNNCVVSVGTDDPPPRCQETAHEPVTSKYKSGPTVTQDIPIADDDLSSAARVLRVLRNEQLALPTTPQQLLAIASVLRGDSLLFVAPTGSGKTTVALAHLGVGDGSAIGTTVVFAPLRRLQHQYQSSLIVAGVKPHIWTEESNSTTSSAVVVSVEYLNRPKLRGYIAALAASRRLQRIVLDEIHIIKNDASFRDRLLLLPTVLSFAPNVPILCMSATFQPIEEPWLGEVLKRDFRVIRTPTTRDNIKVPR